MRSFQRVAASIAFSALMAAGATCARAEDAPLGVRLVDQMNALYGAHPGVRANHAKGAVFEGMFTPAQGADALSSAVFLKGAPTPLIIRFSNAGGVPDAPDTLLSTHPAALAFVTAPRPVAVSYGTQPFFGVNAFKFTNAQGTSKFGRYRIVPESGPAYVSDEEAAKRPPNALADNLRASLEKGPVKFRLLVQVAAADDSTTDATKVWPDSRPTVELGEIAVIKALDTKKVENELLFLPTNVTSGIDPSDDPIINTRTEAYAESFGRRTK